MVPGFCSAYAERTVRCCSNSYYCSDDLNVGAVAGLRRIRPAASVARHVLENTLHSMLSGDLATDFAIQMGFQETSLQSNVSREMHQLWLERDCQPNFWTVHIT